MPQAGSPEGEKFRTLGKHLMDGDRGNFGTSEGNAATGAWKAKQTEFTTKMSASQHFPAWNTYLHSSWDKWRLGPRLRLQELHPREGTGVDWWGSYYETAERVQGKAWTDKRSLSSKPLCTHRLQGTVFVSARGRGWDETAVCDHRGSCWQATKEGMSGRSGTSHNCSLWSQRRNASQLATAKACVSVRGGGQESIVATLEVAAATKLWQVQATAHTFLGAYACSLSQGTWDREPVALGECTIHLRL